MYNFSNLYICAVKEENHTRLALRIGLHVRRMRYWGLPVGDVRYPLFESIRISITSSDLVACAFLTLLCFDLTIV